MVAVDERGATALNVRKQTSRQFDAVDAYKYLIMVDGQKIRTVLLQYLLLW